MQVSAEFRMITNNSILLKIVLGYCRVNKQKEKKRCQSANFQNPACFMFSFVYYQKNQSFTECYATKTQSISVSGLNRYKTNKINSNTVIKSKIQERFLVPLLHIYSIRVLRHSELVSESNPFPTLRDCVKNTPENFSTCQSIPSFYSRNKIKKFSLILYGL